MKFDITFTINGIEQVETYPDCKDVGMAFARCQKDFPGAVMLTARAWGRYKANGKYHEGWTDYPYPAVQRDFKRDPRPARALKPDEKGCEMPFYDEVKIKDS